MDSSDRIVPRASELPTQQVVFSETMRLLEATHLALPAVDSVPETLVLLAVTPIPPTRTPVEVFSAKLLVQGSAPRTPAVALVQEPASGQQTLLRLAEALAAPVLVLLSKVPCLPVKALVALHSVPSPKRTPTPVQQTTTRVSVLCNHTASSHSKN